MVAPWTPSLPRLRNTRNSISSTQPPTKQLLRQDSKKVLVPFNPDTSDSKNDSDGRYSPQVCIFLSASIALLASCFVVVVVVALNLFSIFQTIVPSSNAVDQQL